MYFAGRDDTLPGGGAGAGIGAVGNADTGTGAGGAIAVGTLAHPATMMCAATANAMQSAREIGVSLKMEWFFLEAFVALAIAVAIVAWTMGPKRRRPSEGSPRKATNDATANPDDRRL